MSITLTPLHDLTDGGWDDLVGPSDLFASRAWFGVESARVGPWVPRADGCLVLGSRRRPDAALTLQLFDAETVDDVTVRVDKMLARNCEGLVGSALQPSVLCGGWFNSTVLRAPRLSPSDGARACADLAAAAVEFARSVQAASVFFPYLDVCDDVLCDALNRLGFGFVETQGRHVLEIGNGTHAEYLTTLPSRKRRRIRREWGAVDAAGLTVQHHVFTPELGERAAHLAWMLEAKYGQTSSPDMLRQWFEAIAERHHVDVFVATRHDRTVAVSLWIRHQTRMYGFHAGFDPTASAGFPLYSVIGFHAPIAFAHDTPGVTGLEYGVSSDEAKRIRGTTRHRQDLAVLPLDPRAADALEIACNPHRRTHAAQPHPDPHRRRDAPAVRGGALDL